MMKNNEWILGSIAGIKVNRWGLRQVTNELWFLSLSAPVYLPNHAYAFAVQHVVQTVLTAETGTVRAFFLWVREKVRIFQSCR